MPKRKSDIAQPAQPPVEQSLDERAKTKLLVAAQSVMDSHQEGVDFLRMVVRRESKRIAHDTEAEASKEAIAAARALAAGSNFLTQIIETMKMVQDKAGGGNKVILSMNAEKINAGKRPPAVSSGQQKLPGPPSVEIEGEADAQLVDLPI